MAEQVVGLFEMIEVDGQHGEARAGLLRPPASLLEPIGERRAVRQIGQTVMMGEMDDIFVPGEQLRARRAQFLARLAKTERRLPHLLLQDVEALRHLAELVAGVRLDRNDIDRCVRGLEVAAPERCHGLRELSAASRTSAASPRR